jgi:hypothetical protein
MLLPGPSLTNDDWGDICGHAFFVRFGEESSNIAQNIVTATYEEPKVKY